MNKVSLLALFLLTFLVIPVIYPIVIGSNSAVSRNVFFTFPASDNDNQMLGFCYMDGGVALQDYTTTCTFNSFFPIRQQIFLNNGYLALATNLTLDNVPTFTSLGNIMSADTTVHSLRLAANTATFGYYQQNPVTFTNIELDLQSNVYCDATIYFDKTCRIVGNGNILTLSENANFVVESGSQLELQNIIITGIGNNNISFVDDTASLILTSMSWIQTDSFTFSTGSILFQDEVDFYGFYPFAYASAYTSTIATNAIWQLTDDIFMSIGANVVSGAQPLYFEDSTSTIKFDKCNFEIVGSGLMLTRGQAEFTNVVSFDFISTNTANGVSIGDGVNPINDFLIKFDAAAVLNFNSGYFTYNDTIPNGVTSKSNTATLILTPSANIYCATSQILSNFTFEYTSLLVPPIVVQPGQTLTFDNVTIVFPDFAFVATAQQYSSVSDLLVGNSTISLVNGTLPLALLVLNTGNILAGNGTVGGPIIYLSPTAQLAWSNLGLLNSYIDFNGGSLFLTSDLIMKEMASLIGPGTINLQNKSVQFPIVVTTQTTDLVFTGNGNIVLNVDMTLNATFTFNNSCVIKGNGHTLDITNGNLVVNSDSQLTLQNIVINGLSGTNVSCVDDTGVIILDTTKIIQSDYATFTDGALQWINTNRLQGGNIFAYESSMTSTIFGNTKLHLEPGTTFSFDPPVANGSNTLLQFIDDSSYLVLNGASLITTTSGITLTIGTLDVKRTSYVESSATINLATQRGVSLGDGINDMNVLIGPEAQLYLTQGVLEYRNLSVYSLVMMSNLSAIRIAGGTILQLFSNLNTTIGFVVFDDQAALFATGGSQIIGSINPQGNLIRGYF